jgi:phage terminase large subunit-like protein
MEGFVYFFTLEEIQKFPQKNFWKMACSMGADLSQGDDFCAFTFVFPLGNGCFGIKTRNYITDLTYRRLHESLRDKYDEFIAEGSLVVMDGAVLDMMAVYDELDNYIVQNEYDVRSFGFDPYNAREFVDRWCSENTQFGVTKVQQGVKTESVPLGEIKKLASERMLIFDQEILSFTMGHCIALEDTNGNRKLYKKRREEKIDCVAAMLDAYYAYKVNVEMFD